MMSDSKPTYEPTQTGTEDRRALDRAQSNAIINVTVEAQNLRGPVENVSQAGVLFFSPESLRVTVDIEEDGKTRTLSGRVARVERMSSENSGYAIEFDPA